MIQKLDSIQKTSEIILTQNLNAFYPTKTQNLIDLKHISLFETKSHKYVFKPLTNFS